MLEMLVVGIIIGLVIGYLVFSRDIDPEKPGKQTLGEKIRHKAIEKLGGTVAVDSDNANSEEGAK